MTRVQPAPYAVVCDDCLDWLADQSANTIHGVVTDPPYALIEYSREQLSKRRRRRGGIWRIPPSFDGASRSPVPRFTVLSRDQTVQLYEFFRTWAQGLDRVLRPGAHVVVASTPLLSYILNRALADAGLERRGEVVRLVQTLRGGDRPKGAEPEFPEVSTMPRGSWEPWVLFRKPLEGTVAANLRKWGTGGLRRPSSQQPFSDVIPSTRTPRRERAIANHPSLKPQAFLRQVVRAMLPLGSGVILDPFAGSGSTLAAARAVGYQSIGIERSAEYAAMAIDAIPKLAALDVPLPGDPQDAAVRAA